MKGSVSDEIEVKVGAREAWKLYGTLQLAKMAEEELPLLLHKIDVLEGDGGPGTLLKLTFPPGMFVLLYIINIIFSFLPLGPQGIRNSLFCRHVIIF